MLIHYASFLYNYPRQDTHGRVRVRPDPFRLPPRPTQWCSRCRQRDHTRTGYTASTAPGAPEYTLKEKKKKTTRKYSSKVCTASLPTLPRSHVRRCWVPIPTHSIPTPPGILAASDKPLVNPLLYPPLSGIPTVRPLVYPSPLEGTWDQAN